MARIYEQYVTGEDRELMILEREHELTQEKINFMLETVERQRDLNKREAEFVVLKENGTYDDLMYLYQEADEEAKKNKRGILETILAGIQSIINTIGEALANFGKRVAQNPNEEVEVSQDQIDAAELVKTKWNKHIGKGVVAAAAIVGLALGANHLFAKSGNDENADPNAKPKKIKMASKKLDETICKPINAILDQLKGVFKKDNVDEVQKAAETEITDESGNKIEHPETEAQGLFNKLLTLFSGIPGIGTAIKAIQNRKNKKNGQDTSGEVKPSADTSGDTKPSTDASGDAKPSTGDEPTGESANEFIESLLGFEFDDDEYFDESVDDDDEILDALDAIFA